MLTNYQKLAAAALLAGAAAMSACSAPQNGPIQAGPQVGEQLNAAAVEVGEQPDAAVPGEAEYLAAVEATQQCVAADGFTVSPVFETPTGDYQFNVSVEADETSPEIAEAIEESYSRCSDEHLSSVALQYHSQNLTGEAREAAMEQLVNCLEQAGISGLSTDETVSQVFVTAIMAEGDQSEQAYNGLICFDTYREVWPPGDPNSL